MHVIHHAAVRSSDHAAAPSPFSRVVAGIDFGPASLAAARWGFANVARDAHGILSHVVAGDSAGDGHARHSLGQIAGRSGTRELMGGLNGFAATLDLTTSKSVVGVGRPSHWLNVLTDDYDASLVVLGRRGDANRRRVGEPNVLERLARRTTASVLVVPEGSTTPPSHVVVAVDRSAASEAALAMATAIANAYEYSLIVLHVLPPSRDAGPYQRVIGKRARQTGGITPSAIPLTLPSRDAHRWMARLTARSSNADIRAEITVGDPAREIVSTALGLANAMVVVGKRGDDDAPAGSLGSVARELLTTAHVPVLAVDT